MLILFVWASNVPLYGVPSGLSSSMPSDIMRIVLASGHGTIMDLGESDEDGGRIDLARPGGCLTRVALWALSCEGRLSGEAGHGRSCPDNDPRQGERSVCSFFMIWSEDVGHK